MSRRVGEEADRVDFLHMMIPQLYCLYDKSGKAEFKTCIEAKN